MEIELSSWRAFARSTSLTREERPLPLSSLPPPSLEEGGWLYSVEVEGAGASAWGDELSGWTRRHAVVGSCNSRKLKDNRAEVTPPPLSHPPLLLLALLRTPLQPDNAHPLSFTLVFHVTAKRWWLPTRRKRGTDGG